MPNKYKLKIRGNSLMEIEPPGNDPPVKGCTPDFEFLERYLSFSFDAVNQKSIDSKIASEIIGKQIWKSVAEAESTLSLPDPYDLFQKLQSGLSESLTITIAYTSTALKAECSIPWELLCIRKGDKNVYLYENESVELIRKYTGDTVIDSGLKQKTADDFFKLPCRLLLYVDGPVTVDERENSIAENYELIQYEEIKKCLGDIANKMNHKNAEDPFNESGENDLFQLKFIKSDITKLIAEIDAWKPSVVHFITHGEYEKNVVEQTENKIVKILVSKSGNGFEWMKTDKFMEMLQQKCTWCVPAYFFEVCHLGSSDLPLLLSSLYAKIVVANMFKINQQLSYDFYNSFYSEVFAADVAKRETFLQAFHSARKKIFKPNDENPLSYYGLPVLYYNFDDIDKERKFLEAINITENISQGKKGSTEAETDDDLFNKYYKELEKKFENSNETVNEMAVTAVRLFISFMNTEELKRRFSSRGARLDLFDKWINNNFHRNKLLYNYLPENYESIFEKFYKEERFGTGISGLMDVIKPSAQTNIAGGQDQTNISNTQNEQAKPNWSARF